MLSLLFVITATLYSSIGLGGGSTYIAIMVLVGINASQIPITALICNICVVSINLFRYRGTPFPYRTLIPLLCTSIPMAYLGGQTEISPTFFQLLLGTVLILSGFAIGIRREHCLLQSQWQWVTVSSLAVSWVDLPVWISLGGGIFDSNIARLQHRSPLTDRTDYGLHLFNSISGLIGQLVKFLFPFGSVLLAVSVMMELFGYTATFKAVEQGPA